MGKRKAFCLILILTGLIYMDSVMAQNAETEPNGTEGAPVPPPVTDTQPGIVTQPEEPEIFLPPTPAPMPAPSPEVQPGGELYFEDTIKDGEPISLDFKDVDISAFTRFVSEITGRNFILNDKVRGKVTVFSPQKVSKSKLYEYFLSILDSRGLGVVPSTMSENLFEIVPLSDMQVTTKVHVYKLMNTAAEEVVKPLTAVVARAGSSGQRGRARWKDNEFEGKVSVVADNISNSLFISATDADFEILKKLIANLDVAGKQVFVEVVIMEVASDKIDQLGAELRATNAFANLEKNELMAVGGTNFGGIGPASTVQGFNSVTGLAAGLVQGTFKFGTTTFLNVGALLRMLRSESDTNVLSTPQILATDRQTARIVVGENLPFVKGQSQTSGGNVQVNIERQDVGITLEFTPHIQGTDKVQLKVAQKIDAVTTRGTSAVETGGIPLGPETRKRQVETTIVANNLQTVMLGGLIVDNLEVKVDRVPFLSKIPLLGWLFRFKSSTVRKSNLLVFMTPFIINTREDMEKILDFKRSGLPDIAEKTQHTILQNVIKKEAINVPK